MKTFEATYMDFISHRNQHVEFRVERHSDCIVLYVIGIDEAPSQVTHEEFAKMERGELIPWQQGMLGGPAPSSPSRFY